MSTKGLNSERFTELRTLRDDHTSKTILANDVLGNKEQVIVKFTKRGHFDNDPSRLIEHFSWAIGVKHDHIAKTFDAGLTRQCHVFYVREYLPESQLLSMDVDPLLKPLVSGVDFLLRHQRVHGAIRPSNIFAAAGTLKFADHQLPGTDLRDEEETIHFSAPEVLRGLSNSRESDLYSLGAVLYRMFAGRHLFEDKDSSRLKSKYLSAASQHGLYLPLAWQSLSSIVVELMSRIPEKRLVAFKRLKETLGYKSTIAIAAPFVGRQELLQEVLTAAKGPHSSLRVVLVEGEIGSGKSRFLSELRTYCAFRGPDLIDSRCTPHTSPLLPVRHVLRKLAEVSLLSRASRPNIAYVKSCLANTDVQTATTSNNEISYPIEKTVSDLISALSYFAKCRSLAFAIENIHFADDGTLAFLRQLAFRGNDCPLTLILTTRPSEHKEALVEPFTRCLKERFVRVRLPALSDDESNKCVSFFEVDHQRRRHVVKLSSGNPLFLETYAKSQEPSNEEPVVVAQAVESMLSGLPTDAQAALEVLSIFTRPVDLSVIASLVKTDPWDLAVLLQNMARLGLVNSSDTQFSVRFPALQSLLYRSISRVYKVRLNRMAFSALSKLEPDREVLSNYALEGRMFSEAGAIYRDLANESYKLQEFQKALTYYERLRKCSLMSGETLGSSEILNIAHCYDKVGKRRASDPLYNQLLSFHDVQRNPTLLSRVYRRLAITTERISVSDRLLLLEKAIGSLPDDPAYLKAYAATCNFFARLGHFSRAEYILAKMEAYQPRGEDDLAALNTSRASVLLNSADFRGAAKYYLLCLTNSLDRASVLNNLAYCCEQTGDLGMAFKYQTLAYEFSEGTGNLLAQIQSLDNFAAIKTKSGEMAIAKDFLKSAQNLMVTIDGGEVVDKDSVVATLQADTAIYALHVGDYRLAKSCIGNIRKTVSTVVHLDRLICEMVRCKFLIEIGLTKSVVELIRKFDRQNMFDLEFLQVERFLMEARLPEVSAIQRATRLALAYQTAERLGTTYQQCEVLIALASVHSELLEMEKASAYAQTAIGLAHNKGYKILEARGLLSCGLAARHDKQHFLLDAYRLASEMGLQELIAESAYHIGILNLEAGNVVTAREYLIRSTAITARLAEEVPVAARPRYLAKSWRREALSALHRSAEAVPLHAAGVFHTDAEKYFAAAYRFTMASAAANSVEVLLSAIETTLAETLARSAVITIKTGSDSHTVPVKIKVSPELMERIQVIRTNAKARVYFESADDKGRQVSAWIPLTSETCEGGIYLAYRPHDSAFSEKEIEFLTLMGTVGSSALRRLEARQAREIEPQGVSEFHGLVGASKVMKDVCAQIRMAATNSATVLIEGESGTGKELVAKAIHAVGPRAKSPFIPVDCGAIPEGLIEAELFGSKKGAYTGASADRPGVFEAAHKGTIFLDEISNMPLPLQVKLLRVIQEREVRRIGETRGRPIDVRIIAASNQNLETLSERGGFRKDLLYRLKVLYIKVPALRNRRDDIPMLAHTVLQKLNASNKAKKCFAAGVIDQLSAHKLPGNVRELQNAIERAFFSTAGIIITAVPLDGAVASTAASSPSQDEIQGWFNDLSEGRKDFWSAIYSRYKRRDISREKVVALVDFGLRSTRGSYKAMAGVFRLKPRDYRRFMDFLRRNDCLLDFRPYRKGKGATPAHEN
jgi:DNA-binding NtrC family response regulator/serine/threonine protein kinase/tetratricopeptide (TPR) repeat protein